MCIIVLLAVMWLNLSIIFCLNARKIYAFGGNGIVYLVSVQFFHPLWKLTSGSIALDMGPKIQEKSGRFIWCVIVWSIWCHRNDCVFNDFSFVGDKLLEETKYSFSHWQSNTAACIVDGHLQLLVSCLILAATEVWSFQLYGRRGFVAS